ncbi:hypothetical protein G6F40_018231 [Rhizopus arrhizus]|nr:hypothetical protein G6F40_018231 [Rhizopus arrhizus]
MRDHVAADQQVDRRLARRCGRQGGRHQAGILPRMRGDGDARWSHPAACHGAADRERGMTAAHAHPGRIDEPARQE